MESSLALRAPALPATLAQSLGELPLGSQSQVQIAQGRLSAFLGYAGCDRAVGIAKYALRVLNNTSVPARARLYVESNGEQRHAYPLDFEIAPYSMRDDMVPVRLDATGPYDRAIVEITSEGACFTVEAPPPPPQRRSWGRAAALAAIPLLAAFAATAASPRVLTLAAPAKAVAGSAIRVPFQVSGAGGVEYDFTTRDGLQLAAGLASRSGVLQLRIPASGEGAPYRLHVRIRNALMGAERAATIAAVVPPAPKKRAARPVDLSPLIQELAVEPSPVRAGALLSVKYATSARSGDVWLVGADGRSWAKAPLSAAGLTQMTVPQAASGQEMRIVLHAQRGKLQAQSAVALSVLPAAVSKPPALPHRATAHSAPTLTLDTQVASPGDTVVVRVAGSRGDVRITLMNAAGTVVEQGSVSEQDGAISLTAPSVSAVSNFFVVATYTAGVSEQSIVRRLVVTPR